MNRAAGTLAAAAAIAYLLTMTVTGALPVQRQRVQFEAKGLLRIAPEAVARVELVRGDDRVMLVRVAGAGWKRTDAAVALDAQLAERLSLAVQFLHTSAPVRALAPQGLSNDRGQFGLDQAVLSVVLHTAAGTAMHAHFGGPSPDGMLQYLRVDERPEIFLMSRFVGQQWHAVAESILAR